MADDYTYDDPDFLKWNPGRARGGFYPRNVNEEISFTDIIDPYVNLGIPEIGILGGWAEDPRGMWEAAQYRDMGSRAFNPMFQSTIGRGFTPAYGGYLMSGGRGWEGAASPTGNPFADYLTMTAGYAAPSTRKAKMDLDWQEALAASRYQTGLAAGTIDPSAEFGETGYAPPPTTQAATIGGYLQNDPRSSAIAMSLAKMGGGVGALGSARQKFLTNLYDIYGARARSTGGVEFGFLDYLDSITGGKLGSYA